MFNPRRGARHGLSRIALAANPETSILKVVKCSGCKTRIPEGKLQCPACKRWANASASDEPEVFTLSELPDVDEKRIVTGGPWDAAWGGGFVVNSVTLYGGGEGAGKSTSLLQIAAALADLDVTTLYLSKEEPLEKVKSRVRRIGLTPEQQSHVRITRNFTGTIRDLLERERPGFLIVDSLPALVGIGWTDVAEAVEILETIKEYAVEHECPAIVVDHLNADDEFSGPRAFRHLIDVTMMLTKVVLDKKETDFRTLVPRKSRDGAVNVATHFQMTPRGLVWVSNFGEKGEDPGEGAVQDGRGDTT